MNILSHRNCIKKEQLMTVNEMGRQNDELIVTSNPHEEDMKKNGK